MFRLAAVSEVSLSVGSATTFRSMHLRSALVVSPPSQAFSIVCQWLAGERGRGGGRGLRGRLLTLRAALPVLALPVGGGEEDAREVEHLHPVLRRLLRVLPVGVLQSLALVPEERRLAEDAPYPLPVEHRVRGG